jgi:uncharacterized protein
MLREHPDGILLSVRVQPGSRKTGIQGMHGKQLKVAVHAPPEKGKANDALIEVLAKSLGLGKRQVLLQQGATNQNKVLLLLGINLNEAVTLLSPWTV